MPEGWELIDESRNSTVRSWKFEDKTWQRNSRCAESGIFVSRGFRMCVRSSAVRPGTALAVP